MKKALLLIVGALLVLVVMFGGWFASTSNRLVSLDEAFSEKKAQVENVYQRRADLIPNLVSTVKGYAKHEETVFVDVAKARASVGQVHIDKPEDLQKFDQAQGQLSNALSRLMVVAEKYPELKADKNFSELQSQLEGTENRITIERQRFNEAAREFNTYSRSFPASIVAAMRGFGAKTYFQAKGGTDVAPKVEF